ncbi:hypothetical protein K1719_041941 [Acacia pycnantha]|nr:hypothetical protein K1719_041941 [Acacia pycnantha]
MIQILYDSWLCVKRTMSILSRVCGNPHGLIRKYGLICCRQCFRSNAKEIGFIKASAASKKLEEICRRRFLYPFLEGLIDIYAKDLLTPPSGIKLLLVHTPCPFSFQTIWFSELSRGTGIAKMFLTTWD